MHSHSHTHSHSHGGDEAPLQAGLSHGHSHGGGEALRHGGNVVQRALAAFFRLCGLMQLANLLRNSLPVISAAWVCMVRPLRLLFPTRPCAHAQRRAVPPQVVAGGAGLASHFALVPAASAAAVASAATCVVYLLVGLPEARPLAHALRVDAPQLTRCLQCSFWTCRLSLRR